ncbi:MAG: TIGR04190 family B12-binding domain/radical SAM domain protein [Acidobacteria bacterium]|nr:TIGR04190 family B12-binding domain/radical SAM domain protein [Acidobacteriota bacterium]MBV9188395.1 TIGR04190 family B12-binding domain/radical SAM domain protein [Acidobacteriota bacterium]
MKPDVVLIHPPSVFDFRERSIVYGPISDVIPSTPVFEMYPIGFLTLAAFLRRHGYRVRIVNLALRMMRSRRFQPEAFLRKQKPKLFGIDLHWLPHAQGGPAVAALLKQIHPEIPIVFGGISATCFHRELIDDPSVDFVLRGSVTEPSLLALVRELEGERRFEDVPGLTWKRGGEVIVNPDAVLPASLDDFDFDLGMMIREVVRHLDFWTSAPFQAWWRHPITAVFTVRGCARRCVTCGASSSAFRRFMPGHHPLLRSPEAIATQVRKLAQITRTPIFLVGDLRDGGKAYASAVIDALARVPVSNRIVFEFFDPPDRDLVQRIDAAILNWGAELSPESHDESIRALLGKARFTNARMEEAIEAMLASRCRQLDLFYMIGLPGQTTANVMTMVDAIEQLFIRFDRRLSAFITPMAPFVDPGSDGFADAESHGYRLRARTLVEHRALLETDNWESMLNYETEWMTRAEMVEATYAAAERLNDLKRRYGRISDRRAAGVDIRRRAAREQRGEQRASTEGTLNDKAELFEPGTFLRNFRLGGILRMLAGAFFSAPPRLRVNRSSVQSRAT